jgi:Rod binding domain-containing protein
VSTALPPIDQSAIPAGVRAQGPKAVALYDVALNFEGVLDQQLTQSLTNTLDPSDSGDGSDDGSTPDAATSLMMQMLPQELSQSLISSGGLGLAPQLYQELGGTMATPSTASTTSTTSSQSSAGAQT